MFGKDLISANVASCAQFLAGACGCEVKELNPGVDLLMVADWDAIVEGRPAVEPATRPIGKAVAKGGVSVPIPVGLGATTQKSAAGAMAINGSGGASGGGAVHSTPFAVVIQGVPLAYIGIGLAAVAALISGLALRSKLAK